MSKLKDKLDFLLDNYLDIKEIDDFFCNRYRINKYLSYALHESLSERDSDIIIYILKKHLKELDYEDIRIVLELSVLKNKIDLLDIIKNNYKEIPSAIRESSLNYYIIKDNYKIIKYIVDNLLPDITDSEICKIIHYAVIDDNKNTIKYIFNKYLYKITEFTMLCHIENSSRNYLPKMSKIIKLYLTIKQSKLRAVRYGYTLILS